MFFKTILFATCVIAFVAVDASAIQANDLQPAESKNIENQYLNPIETLANGRLRRSCNRCSSRSSSSSSDESDCGCNRSDSSSDSSSSEESDCGCKRTNKLKTNRIVHKKICHKGEINVQTKELRRRPSPRRVLIKKDVDISVEHKRKPTCQRCRQPTCGCRRPSCGHRH